MDDHGRVDSGRLRSPTLLRHRNERRVFAALVQLGPASLAELTHETGLARGTVHSAVKENGALHAGLAAPRDVRLSSGPGGRATSYFSLKPYVAIGVDFDHDRVRVCITDIRGAELWAEYAILLIDDATIRAQFYDAQNHRVAGGWAVTRPDRNSEARAGGPVDAYPKTALATAVQLAEKGLARLNAHPPRFWPNHQGAPIREPDPQRSRDRAEPVTRDHVIGIGVAIAAPVNTAEGTPSERVFPEWKRIKPAEELRAALRLDERVRLLVDNDANAGAWAEYRYAASNGERYGFSRNAPPRSLLYVKTAGGPSGVGAGLVLNSQIYRGATYAGELGHLPLPDEPLSPHEAAFLGDPDDPDHPCPHCGKTTCLQARTDARLLMPGASEDETWDAVHQRAREMPLTTRLKSDEALALVEAGRRLGKTLAIAVTLLNPDVIVVGGPLSHVLVVGDDPDTRSIQVAVDPTAPNSLLDELRTAALPDSYSSLESSDDRPPAVLRTAVGWWAVARGAAALVLDFETEPFALLEEVVDIDTTSETIAAAG